MAKDPGMGYKVVATVIDAKGECEAGHKVGDTFELSAHNPSEMCGMFYHDVLPSLTTLQFGGSCPWWQGNTAMARCSDPFNTVTIKMERFEREGK